MSVKNLGTGSKAIFLAIGHCFCAYLYLILFSASIQPVLAQASAPSIPPGPLPTDVTPIRIREEKEIFTPGTEFYLFNKLPPRLWFNFTLEESQRLETNVYLKQFAKSTDYVFRSFPNLTVGYSLYKGGSIYCNYFVIKDVYARNPHLTGPTTQSLSLGFRQELPIGEKSSLQFDFQSRELWQAAGLQQADLIPGVLFNRVLTDRLIAYTNIQMQMRGADYFVAPTREIDPFYTVGLLYSYKQWLFSAVDTFITNYRAPYFNGSIPKHGNEAMIADFEAAHPVAKKLPGLVAFLRAEPVWNWNSGGTPGISGFDFRLYSGLRYSLNKSPYNGAIDKLRKQLLEMQSTSNPATGMPPTSIPFPTNTSPGPSSTLPAPSGQPKTNSTANMPPQQAGHSPSSTDIQPLDKALSKPVSPSNTFPNNILRLGSASIPSASNSSLANSWVCIDSSASTTQ